MTDDRPSPRLPARAPGPRQRGDPIWDGVSALLAERAAAQPTRPLEVVDVGGGSGVHAVQIAARGHRVTVVDPSPNALATLERRALDADVADRIVPVQGDAGDLPDLVPPGSADLMLCHGVLNVVDDPVAAIASVTTVAAVGTPISVVVTGRHGTAVGRAFAGHVAEALAILRSADGTYGDPDPLSRRFTAESVVDLLTEANLSVRAVHGVRTFSDLVGSGGTDEIPDADQIGEIDDLVSAEPAFRSLAATLHVLTERRS